MKITRALISVSDKTDLEIVASKLAKNGVEILSTGGTAKYLQSHGINIVDVSDYTNSPEIMNGRVKTLHPKIHGGLLGVLDNDEHVSTMQEHDIHSIDLVIVNLYPFEKTLEKDNANFEEIIENIDIGGPSMVRSSAKNYKFTTIVTDIADYDELNEQLDKNDFATTIDFRKKLAAKAFARCASYDTAIGNWFALQENDNLPKTLNITASLKQNLRYGENPHQKAGFYVYDNNFGIGATKQLQGKELSYNNINDADAALSLVCEFQEPCVAIIKHANPCGVAIADNITEAYIKALASDPVSAFGGIIAINRTIDIKLANELSKIFIEAIIAPRINDDALQVMSKKKNLRVLITSAKQNTYQIKNNFMVKHVAGGLLLQENDDKDIDLDNLKLVTKRSPTDAEKQALLFAFKVCKHVKSNAIVLAKNNATIGSGAGQTSRVDSVKIAISKANEFVDNPNRSNNCVLASDAFFPFADGVETAAKSGVKAIIQPGGSIRDEEVIKAADDNDIAMLFTNQRHFKH